MRNQLFKHLKGAVKDGLTYIQNEIRANENNELYWYNRYHKKYPKLEFDAKTGYPTFLFQDREAKDYGAILRDREFFHSIPSWQAYHTFVVANPILAQYYEIGAFRPDWVDEAKKDFFAQIHTYYFLASFVDSYIHRYSLAFNEQHFETIATSYANAVELKELPIDIVVPILYVQFDTDHFQLGINVSIQRMDDRTQLSRNEKTNFASSAHRVVVARATHALVIGGFTVKNSGYTSLQWTLDDIDTFKPAKDIIERAMASLRIGIPNLETGYAQVIARPKGWEFYFTQDISDCFVAIERAYPGYFERYGWLKFSATVTFAELEKVRRAFLTYGEVPQLQLGYKRLNKACINSREDDTIIDIMIALESLLTSDSKSEITYRLATRAVLLNKLMPFGRSTDKEVFDFCKKIYDFRSSVVHGSPQKQQNKKRLIKVNQDREIQAIEGGLEFLKHVLWVLINHPMKPEEIDNIIYN